MLALRVWASGWRPRHRACRALDSYWGIQNSPYRRAAGQSFASVSTPAITPVRGRGGECAAYALSDPDLNGIWGGLSSQERGQLGSRIGEDWGDVGCVLGVR
jgi:Transcription factor WhiB